MKKVPAEESGEIVVKNLRQWRHFTRRRAIIAAVVVGLLVISGGTWAGLKHFRAKPAAAASEKVVKVTSTSMNESITATGTVAPKQRADLSFGSTGKVLNVFHKVGDKVKKGTLLAQISDQNAKLAVDRANADVEKARKEVAELRKAKASKARIRSAQAAVKTAQHTLENAKKTLGQTKITAPFDGTIAEVNVTTGQEYSGSGAEAPAAETDDNSDNGADPMGGAGPNTDAGPEANSAPQSGGKADVILVDLSGWRVTAHVRADAVKMIKKNMAVECTKKDSTEKFSGKVESVGTVAKSLLRGRSAKGQYPVTIIVPKAAANFQINSQVDVAFILKSVPNALVVPTDAIRYKGEKTYVVRRTNGKDEEVTVSIGFVSEQGTQVLSGLAEGDQIVVTSWLADGDLSGGEGGGDFPDDLGNLDDLGNMGDFEKDFGG